jgi:hypothetical protein
VRLAAAAAALLVALVLAACGGTSDGGPLSVAEASREAPEDTVVSVKGTLVFEHGQAMLCSHLAAPEEEGTRCGSPVLWVKGRLDPDGWTGSWPVQWKESVVLRGTVGGGFMELADTD